ncbi:MAG: hypothetical protein K9L76_00210 [Candidatus Omnitrophica bacterium]|nr:hypothetical protein [Candidatus Omnitrophota bacterium]
MKYRKLTEDDFVPRVYDWVKISKYAITKDGCLIKFEKQLSDGSPVYLCLWESWWEMFEACHSVSIRDILEAEPVNSKIAKAIMNKEEKPLAERPKERNSWVCPY